MKVVIQRTKNAKVEINNSVNGSIENGLVILVGFTYGDTIEDIEYMVNKIINLRIFDDENGVMNKSILEVGGTILSISQFTLYADCKKSGNRPSYSKAMKASEASLMYDLFNKKLSTYVNVGTGIFGSDMKVSITNDGPVTILLESE